jgi:Flp pilus assembly pilin Flp
MTLLLRFLKDDRGATAIEYGLVWCESHASAVQWW